MWHLTKPAKMTVSNEWVVRVYKVACEEAEISEEFLGLESPMIEEMLMALEDAGIIERAS